MKIRLNVYPGLLGLVLVFTLGRHGLRGEEEGPEGTSVAAGGGRRHWVHWASLLGQGQRRVSAGLRRYRLVVAQDGGGMSGQFSASTVLDLSRASGRGMGARTLLPCVSVLQSP